MTTSGRTAGILGVVVAVLAVAGVLVAVARSGDEDSDGARVAVATTTSTSTTENGAPVDAGGAASAAGSSVAGSAATGPAPAPSAEKSSPTPRPAQAGPTPASGAATADPGPAQDPGPTQIARDGTYRYRYTFDGSSRESTAKVETKSRSQGDTRQLLTIESEQGQLTSELSWGPDSVRLMHTAVPRLQAECDWKPPVVQLKLPLSEKPSWSIDSTCEGTASGQPFKIRRVGTAKVVRLERIVIGDRAVDVWRLEGTDRTELTAGTPPQQFSSVTEGTSTSWFSPRYGIAVRFSSKSRTTANGSSRDSTFDYEALSVDPS